MKMNRTVTILVLAGVLMLLVMCVAAFVTFSGMANREQYAVNRQFTVEMPVVDSANITDLTGDGQRDLFLQNQSSLQVLDGQGNVLLSQSFPPPIVTTLGDVTGDGLPDILVYSGSPAQLTLLTGLGEVLWQQSLVGVASPGRAAALDFEDDRRSEFVIGDQGGHLVALSADGATLWKYTLSGSGAIRGLDDVATPEGDLVAAGLEGGLVVVLGENGNELWRAEAGGGLRRLRAFPLDNPLNSLVFIGGVDGTLSVREGATGREVWSVRVGQAVNEIRPVEIDGDPATTEVMVGGKDGGLWAYSQTGQPLWRGFLNDKVNELASLNSADLGGAVVVAGDDTGRVGFFGSDGTQLAGLEANGSVSRLDVGKLGDVLGVVVADSRQASFYTVTKEQAPIWFTPLLAGLIACVVIAGVAFALASLKPAPTVAVSAQAMTVEAQKARRRMLHESLHDLKAMESRGEVSGEAYLARMKTLRGQLAGVNEALIKLGEPIQPETITCPNCNGTLELGTDRCEYCGQIVIV